MTVANRAGTFRGRGLPYYTAAPLLRLAYPARASCGRQTPRAWHAIAFHEKAVKLFLKFISHFLGGGGIVLPSGLGMLVHVLIRCCCKGWNVAISFSKSLAELPLRKRNRSESSVLSWGQKFPRTPAAATGAGLGGAQPPSDRFKPWWGRIHKVHGISRA